MARAIADRPSTGYAAQYGITPPPGYKVNVDGQVVPEGNAQAVYDANHGFVNPNIQFGSVDFGPDPADPGGYPNDGSGNGSGAVAPPPRYLASSPEWLAYLNALGLEEGQFRADIDRQRALLKVGAEQQIGDIGAQGQLQRGGIAASAEGRGTIRSGQYLKNIGQQQAAQGRSVAGVQTGLAGQMGGLETQLATKLIDLGARRAQEELSLRSQGYQ